MSQVYLDWNATTPPHPDVVAAMGDAAHAAWANPSSLHAAGRAAKAIVEQARERIAQLMGFCARDVLFTSGGTEANNLAVVRPFLGAAGPLAGGTCITSRLEHPSVVAVVEQLASRGVHVIWLDVPPSGRLEPESVARALLDAAAPCLVAVQSVNHETGVVQPVGDIVALAARAGAEVHVDAVQGAGRLAPAAWEGAHTVAIAAHKMRGPKGVGALLVQPGITVRPLLRGGGQERGLRPGTIDAVAAAGFGVAAKRAEQGPARYAKLSGLRDALEERLARLGARIGGAPLRNGEGVRAPHVSNMSWPGWAGDELAAALDLEGVCVSAGSACAAGTPEPSRVIAAMLGESRARSALRVSLGEETTENDLERAIVAYERVLTRHLSSS
ncbi:MAG TPA: cysteine desulfurase family protein [Polyangiaceae bacterium]|nr:cysteine desulfurase family protein [Polyangiaceae bacterium]